MRTMFDFMYIREFLVLLKYICRGSCCISRILVREKCFPLGAKTLLKKKSLSNTLQAKLEQLRSLNITYKQQVSEYFSS